MKYEYKRPGGEGDFITAVQASRPGDSVSDRTKPYGKYTGGVLLPMPKVSDSNGAEWGKSDLSVFGLGLASILNAGITGLGEIPTLSSLGEQVQPGGEDGANKFDNCGQEGGKAA